jgi:hypothetical protein
LKEAQETYEKELTKNIHEISEKRLKEFNMWNENI